MKRFCVTAYLLCIAYIGNPIPLSRASDGSTMVPLPCLIKPDDIIAVGSSVTGVLERITVKQGDIVSAGDVIATLESSLERAEVAVAQGKAHMEAAIKKGEQQVAFTGRKVKRAKELRLTKAIAEHELDEAETEEQMALHAYTEAKEAKAQAELELARAQVALALRTIRSPINGMVIERLVSPGELVREVPVIRLAKLDPLRVDVYAPSSMLGKIKPGMRADVRINSPLLGPYVGEVFMVNPLIEPASSTFAVRLEMANPGFHIPAGARCFARFAGD